MTTPSIKNSNTKDIEAAIAQTLAKLTGWEGCATTVESMEFKTSYAGERISLTLDVRFSTLPQEGEIPF